MNLLCKVQHSACLIRLPVDSFCEPAINDFIYKWDSWNSVFADIQQSSEGFTDAGLNAVDLASSAHWKTAWPVYDYVVDKLRECPLLGNLPRHEDLIYKYGKDAVDHLAVKFTAEDRIGLMSDEWHDLKIVDYEDLLSVIC
ncbi:hypothetical protein N836_31310 [Leptolyngbya sp. Heron Island J]|uniref:hypothetical protein n=1 Tax=Leptolyngbya sp. Heron Island J TaxID=1385935 RepID=UPI0003B94625|nr:hypothetical protein [Leptolyngbya sp. Heron Island J]ESA38430.1 hypothetical protein N836_31310 [Leptolyngbya sp. Heron Island J]